MDGHSICLVCLNWLAYEAFFYYIYVLSEKRGNGNFFLIKWVGVGREGGSSLLIRAVLPDLLHFDYVVFSKTKCTCIENCRDYVSF